jgi:hypothetical protein
VDPLAIRRVGLDGSGLELYASPADFPWSLDLDDTGEWLYYSNVSAKEIHRLSLTTKADEVTARGAPAYDPAGARLRDVLPDRPERTPRAQQPRR